MNIKKVLVAGATGYLGQFLVKALKEQGYWVRVLIRKEEQKTLFNGIDDYFFGNITDAKSLKDVTKGIDYVFSCVGITRQEEGLTYMDVDYKGNSNLLKEAVINQVKGFQYISAINGDRLRHLKIFEAKERFVDELKSSGLNYCISRPNGFFSDMKDFLEMAKSGRVYLFGKGHLKLNPIHGQDLAKVCVSKMHSKEKEYTVGGMDILSHDDLAKLALKAVNKPFKITHLPDWTRRLSIWVLRTFSSSKSYGPIEFFLTAMATDNIADAYGEHRLEDFFNAEANKLK